MKITDYTEVANVYDENRYRFEEVQTDTELENFIKQNPRSSYNVLDLACGTGIYLHYQATNFNDVQIQWHGLDASMDMLHKAKERLKGVSLEHGLAEEMPYEEESMNFILNNYAFHHFTEKEQVLDEIQRVLKKEGVYKLHNIDIHGMKNWWIYHYFPSAYREDLKRFWTKELIFAELDRRGFNVKIDCNYQMKKVKVADYLDHVKNRDISVLTLLDDKEYAEGLDRIIYDLNRNSDKEIINDFSELICVAQKI
ncbi:class I SAM-dependent methyltransferase [Halobacillus naozhouensis]|uniref:Class I SAM-dependent methyltransferase n=1 Tax=Halobacillus naozhouensis TaxID=554880 RepID=A0ABY8J627_9BACI|nr:class I SAM-dependent methyltransferase [Halobacillus naozhouensis]WFT76356.1 class I SAM-dependent methyltransferase [Halobacillus naozhouensis]